MSLENNKKLIVVSIVTVILAIILVCIMLVDIPTLGIYSLKTILSKNGVIESKEAELLTEKNSYTSSKQVLETAKSNYEKEKSKYESITDETVRIINESNTKENYSLEYMWIKLGNYAEKNNLSLVMVEPGNTSALTTQKDGESVVEQNSISNAVTSSNVLKIEVTGSYIDLSDFIFEVENDTELKFKLDNISMQYVSGTTIKTTFDVKNIVIEK